MTEIRRLIAHLSPGKRALLARRNPLSSAQRRLWFLDQLEPGSSVYNGSVAVELNGRLGVAALDQALGEVARRHEPLRTAFPHADGRPLQFVLPPVPVPLPLVDLCALRGTERAAVARRLTAEMAQRPFDLAAAPPLRVTLLRRGEMRHTLLLTMHHIISDRWTMDLFGGEIVEHYAAFLAGSPSALAEPEVQYADYARRQQKWLGGEECARQLDYWREELAGPPPALALPADRPRAAARTSAAGRRHFAFDRGLGEAVRQLCGRESVTPYMVLLAAFQMLLCRLTGQHDFTLGTAVAGRYRAEYENLLGLFVNVLVMRSQLGGDDPSFAEVLGRVRRATLEAYARREVPFERLVEELQPERDLNHSPLFQVTFSAHNTPASEHVLPGLTLRMLEVEAAAAKHDLMVSIIEQGRGLRGYCEYDTARFDHSTVTRLLGHFQRLLRAAVADTSRRLSALPLLSEAEAHQLLLEWNDTEKKFRGDSCLHQLFEEQAARTPDAVALSWSGGALTYSEMNGWANRLARRLREDYGVGRECRIGLMASRTERAYVAILAVLKAGGAYVPLDPAYPAERVEFMLANAGVRVLLLDSEFLPNVCDRGVELFALDGLAGLGGPSGNLDCVNTPSDLAYVIYTSGSTGWPKGVMVHHRGVVNLVPYHAARFRIGPGGRLLQFSSLSFDASVADIFDTLLVGATLCLPGGRTSLIGGELLRLLREQEVTVLTIPPSALAATPAAECPALASLVVAGEAAPPGLAARWAAAGRCFLNAYGPTETSVCALVEECAGAREPLPIGRPIDNMRAHTLDRHARPASVGTLGELHLGGVGLSRGYLGRPGLTAERFVPDPYSSEPGARLYRTGDLTRRLADGRLEFAGRVDDQVKVRGYRIELGEVEAALRAQPGVSDAVVLARDDARLVAYYSAVAGAHPSSAELRSRLRSRLPEYMIPSAFVALDALPLTRNGKADRKALRGLSDLAAPADEGQLAPRTEVETRLAEIWAGVLGTERPGLNDNFFYVGHSLLAVQLVFQVCEAFGVELLLRDVFESPTLGGLAARVEALRAAAPVAAPPITPAPREGNLPLSFAQQRFWFFDQLEPGNPAYNLPYALRLEGHVGASTLEQSFNEVARRHEVLRTRFVNVGGQPAQFISPKLRLTLPVVDLRGLPAPERAGLALRLAQDASRRAIDLAAGPVINFGLMRLDDDEHILVFVIHHIVADAWSMEVLTRELSLVYDAFVAGRPTGLAELPVQYADFALWQLRQMQGEPLGAQLAYWKRQLEDSPRVLKLPSDRPRPPLQSFAGAREVFRLPAPLTGELKALGQQRGATLYMTLLAAFAALLSRYTGRTDILQGSPIANRPRPEVEPLIGLFLNTLVLRTRPSGELSFEQFLAQVREVTLEAYAHQEVPFERLVAELQPERALSYAPLVQVLFSFRKGLPPAERLTGLTLSPVELSTVTSKFDIACYVSDEDAGLRGVLEYSTALFEATTIRRLLVHFVTLLTAAAAEPGRRLSELPLMTERERHQLLVEWNATGADYPRGLGLHEFFEAQARRTPDRVALVFENEQLTYRGLDRRADLLGRHLRRLGAGREEIVGICVERSAEMLVGMLGVLKARAAYLPLDPTYPQERLSFILEETGAPILLTQRHLAAALPAGRAHVVYLDEEAGLAGLGGEDSLAGGGPLSADNLAYVIYTSGSTGSPKGVQITQGGVVNILTALARELGLGAEDVLLAVTNITFDIAAIELFLPLLVGARVVVASRETTSDGGRILRQLAADGCTAVQATPATWRMLLASGWPRGGGLKLFSAGEALLPDLAAQLLPRGSALWDVYGPTETTIYSTASRLTRVCDPVPIGRPLNNNRVYILDENLREVPAGVPGKLHIGGDGLARGYLHRPHLTVEKFIPDPFGGEPGARLYDTGDLARYTPEGVIEYLGRLDHQVKVRGFRIELGEVESVLGRHPEVGSAVVAARGEGGENQRLVAYVVPGDRGEAPGLSGRPEEPERSASHVSRWQTVWEETYRQLQPEGEAGADPTFNTTTWEDSYSRRPFSAAEMKEWLDHTVERILALGPRRVLEIGCGTGMLLSRIAPHCEHYCGTDFSQCVLDFVGRNAGAQALPQVTLRRQAADDFAGFEPASFDAVILNSVAQYFPGVDYLVRVIEGALGVLRPGGFIFVGDVRCLPLLEAFHTSVEVYRAPPTLPAKWLRARVCRRVACEAELVIDPAFFAALAERLPQLCEARVLLKRGRHQNELTRFRYDVVLRAECGDPPPAELRRLDWQEQRLSVAGLRRMLAEDAPEALDLMRVPNARLLPHLGALQRLAGGHYRTAGELSQDLNGGHFEAGVDPEDLWALSREFPYAVEVNWAGDGSAAHCDVMLRRLVPARGRDGAPAPARAPRPRPADPKHLSAYANDPLRGETERTLVPRLQAYLRATLPEYMIPSTFVLLDELPLTRSGKVDRRALPEPEAAAPATQFKAPKTDIERAVAALWCEVLGVERVSAGDNFFDLGGHSLLVIQVHSRLRETFKTDLTVVEMFRHPTVGALAARLDRETADRPSFERARDRAMKQKAAAGRQRRPPRPVGPLHGQVRGGRPEEQER
jgi:amino acid adenylation domain-containing protein